MSTHDIKKAIEAEFGHSEQVGSYDEPHGRVIVYQTHSGQRILAATKHGKKEAWVYTFYKTIGKED